MLLIRMELDAFAAWSWKRATKGRQGFTNGMKECLPVKGGLSLILTRGDSDCFFMVLLVTA